MVEKISELIAKAEASKNLTEVIESIKSATLILSSSKSSFNSLDLSLLQSLGKIAEAFSSPAHLEICKFCSELLNHTSNLQSPFVLHLCATTLSLCELLRGSHISESTLLKIEKVLLNLKNVSGAEGLIEKCQELLKYFQIPDIEDKYRTILEEIKSNNPSGLKSLIDLLSSFNKLHIQYRVFEDKFLDVVRVLEDSVNGLGLAEKLIQILELYIYQKVYKVKITEESCPEVYEIVGEYLSEKVLINAVQALQAIIPYEVDTTEKTLGLVHKLWYYFPDSREMLYDLTKVLLGDIAAEGSIVYKTKASHLLYEIMRLDINPDFQESLERDRIIKPLFESSDYKPSILDLYNPLNIPVNLALPLDIEIPSGEDFYSCIEVIKENSILIWGFMSKYYDIGFKIEKVFPQSIILPECRYECSEKAITGSLLVKDPGLYKLIWVNSYSWFKSKQIRYRTALLQPLPRLKGNSNDDIVDVISECALYIPGPSISVRTKSMVKVFYQKAGILQSKCDDSEALARISVDLHGHETVIAVVCDDGVRVSIGYKGEIVFSQSRTGTMEEEIANALAVFGPGYVFVAGVEIDVKELEKELEKRVGKEVVAQSFIRGANKLLAAALRLPE
ncbi:hypothetical protein SteCoe_32096 [Stentor coeruleus]|uniref:GOLD domain-containing protein n=1 Tax=Stentor coeruleus TaxID=5963 RepID=A0A1R2AZR4_9CILI|nr:hypothetical protein SteCoe_32096 [Stentor coeruleus]